MKNFAKYAVLSCALIVSQAAHAHHPLPLSPVSLTGLVDVSKGIDLQCVLTVTFTMDSIGQYWATIDLSAGDALCDDLVFNGGPYRVNYNETNHTVTFENVDVTTISAGDCAGNISATWDGTELSVDSFLPAKTAGYPCTIVGFIG